MTTTMNSRLRRFLDTIAATGKALDPDALSRGFTDPFLAADPTGARPVPRAAFLRALPKRADAFTTAGIGAARLVSVDHQRLDDHYLLVRTEWSAPRLDGEGDVPLASTFLLYDDGTDLRAVLYLNHQGLPKPTAGA
ncbi:hypothetical protein [Micromonospora mirobrigensis]|nr:hypothetical protein [Micromonospora mirobrigensis]